MKIRGAVLLTLFLWLSGLAAAGMLLKPDGTLEIDNIAVNRIARAVERDWDSLNTSDFSDAPYPFSVLEPDGKIRYQTHTTNPVTLQQAIRQSAVILPLQTKQGTGMLLVFTDYPRLIRQRERDAMRGIILLFSIFAFFALAYFLYLRRVVFLPFQRLRSFAVSVAAGNLEAPLKMERNNSFGPFTESFDLMRDELKRARSREWKAQQEKKELVASLSHDIKTPVTAIRLQCELLKEISPAACRDKLSVIDAKASQIDGLITNLFQATLEELGELQVAVEETDSRALEGILRSADFLARLQAFSIPGCILRIDLLRMEQVIDNLLYNSYKYAATPIQVDFEIVDEFLMMKLRDYGGGVPEEELPMLCRKFYRGRNAKQSGQDGSGLGLYLCSYLMHKMGGDMRCRNWEQGLETELLIPLA